jgi:hypothetical protein
MNNDVVIETLVSKLLSVKSDEFEKQIAYTRLLNLGMNDDDIIKYGLDTGKIILKPETKTKKIKTKTTTLS